MSASSTEDFYPYQYYILDSEYNLERKTSKLIAAVVQNNVDILKQELDSHKWYNVKDKNGYSLLQIAILRNNKEVFDYMLSIPDFPFEFVNRNKETALLVALNGYRRLDEHFAYELLKIGACVNLVSDDGNTPLHLALYRCYYKVTLLLIRMGVDFDVYNHEGVTPMFLALTSNSEDGDATVIEIFAALLVEGTVPSVRDFEESVLCYCASIIREHLFLHTVDQHSEIDFLVLLQLAANKSPLFDEILKYSCKIIFSQNYFFDYCFSLNCYDLCSLETNYLMIIIQKFRKFVEKLLHIDSKRCWFNDDRPFQAENLDILIENEFETEVIDFLGVLNRSELFRNLIKHGYDESRISQVYLYLLSYGLILCELDLQLVYCHYGYCELFRLFLHMDVEQNAEEIYNKDIVAVFIFDLTMTIPRFLKDYQKFSYKSINQLFHYFVHPGLTELYYQLTNKGVIPIHDKMPQMPSLRELARNSFRSYFIETFKIETSGKFYTLLKHLPISSVYKKIISYETKLY